MAQFVEVDLDQGTDFNLDVVVRRDDGSVINVAGYTFSSSMRKSFYSSSVTANLTVSVVNAANGNVRFSINSASTANIKAGRYLFDIKQKDTSNTTTRVFEGIITVNPQVTK